MTTRRSGTSASLVFFIHIRDKFPGPRIYSCDEEEEDVEEHERFDLVDGDTGLDVELGESSLAGDDFSDQREGES